MNGVKMLYQFRFECNHMIIFEIDSIKKNKLDIKDKDTI